MKLQDLFFLTVFFILLFKHDPKWFVILGIVCLILSMPLFAFWVFFTAERLTWYAGAFFLAAIIIYFFRKKKKQ